MKQAVDEKRKAILVTGSHRSGSTWVGGVLAQSPRVSLFYEPFGRHGPSPVEFFYQYIPLEEPNAVVADYLRKTLLIEHSWRADFMAKPGLIRLLGASRRSMKSHAIRQGWLRPLMKDPMALLSAEWLAHHFGMQPVVLIRHPLAFVASCKRMQWPFKFQNLWQQKKLLARLPATFVQAIEEQNQTEQDLIGQNILLWNILHWVIAEYQKQHPDWFFVRHEDLSREPLLYFERIYQFLGLSFTARIQQKIQRETGSDNPVEARGVHTLRRNSRRNIWSWQTRLTPEEQARIRAGTAEVAEMFYQEQDWTPPPEFLA